MQEEQDTCRICSAPAEPDQPLYYPCKCSGTIRYIHQDCLTTWLAHSKKKTCDVCKHPYSFTKVYAKNMPPRLPTFLLVRRLAQQTGYALKFALRTVMVGLLWLALLPWATIWTWRMFFTMGNSTAWWISNRPRPTVQSLGTANISLSSHNDSIATAAINSTTTAPSFFSHPVVRAVSADIVAGQIIATVIVIAFVAIFLLREWISQNARPGIFDDADPVPGQDDLPVPVVPVAPPANDAPHPPALRPRDARDPINPAPVQEPPDYLNGEPLGVPNGKNRAEPLHPYRFNSDKDTQLAEIDDSGSHPSPRRRHSWNGLEGTRPDHEQPTYVSPEEFVRREKAAMHARSSAVELGVSSSLPSEKALQKAPNRPPLFSTALFPPDSAASPSRFNEDIGASPPASPSLATYRAPEEFEAGPSHSSGYFQQENDDDDDVEYDEYNLYFHKPEDSCVGAQDEQHDEPRQHADNAQTPTLDLRAEHEDEPPMPGLEQWTDEEFDEQEDDDNAMVEFGGPMDEEDREEVVDLLDRVPGPEEAALDDDEIEAGIEDDMEGALEAIGLRGPLQPVLQNAALMVFVLDTTIAVGVFFPFTMGKSLALLLLDPRRLLYILHFPIRVIRLVTDPIVDLSMFLCARLVVPPLVRLGDFMFDWLYRMSSTVLGEAAADRGIHLTTNLYNRTLEVSQFAVDHISSLFAAPAEAPATATLDTSWADHLLAEDSAFMRVAAPYFAPIGESVRVMQGDVQEAWVKLAVGDGTPEKVFAITLGYAVAVVLIALYLNILTVGSMKSAGRAFRSAVRQQLVVVKVATFIIVELIVFPLGCGVMLDICSVSLFPQGSFRTRAEFLLYAPLTAAFYHWVLGTMFMYQFAILLAGFRSCLRNGALWFIKDPQDQNFHPIRDILERPTLVHVRKLLISAIMYGLVVACGVGTISGILRIFSKTIMPFRWKVRQPLSEVPVDLLFLHIVLPYTLQHFRPKKVVKQGGLHVWKFLARCLRLTSYLFGGRYPEEEWSLRRWTLHAFLTTQRGDIDYISDGTFRRVPNSDNIALAKDEPATVQVNEDGSPVNEKEARIMRILDEEAEKAKRSIKDDYTVAYMPPHFRRRVILFIVALWMVCSAVLAVGLAAPILLGRYFFKLFTPHHVHDGYAFLTGFYLLWGCWIVSTSIERMDKHRQRRGGGGGETRADFPLYVAKRASVWLAQVSYLATMLGFVIPTLAALAMELYIVMPIRQTLQPELQPRIRLVDMWAMGLMYTKIALRILRVWPVWRIGRGVDQIRRHGWTHPQPWTATKDVILPVIGCLVTLIVLPPAVLQVLQRVFNYHLDENVLFLHIYPSIFTLLVTGQSLATLMAMIKTWAQSVRDKEFLVAMQLQNLESGAKTNEPEPAEVETEDIALGDEDEED